jgi:hypothetical protein
LARRNEHSLAGKLTWRRVTGEECQLDVLKTIVELAKLLWDAVKWFAAGGPKRLALGFVIVIAASISIVFLALSEEKREQIWSEIWPWIVAAQPGGDLILSEKQRRIVEARSTTLIYKVRSELDAHFDPLKIARSTSRYSAWTAAQCTLAVSGLPDRVPPAEKVAGFARSSQVPACDCWNEFTTEGTSPEHILISSWILFTLATQHIAPTSGELQFLRETQDGTGGWTMFPMPYGEVAEVELPRPQGSSFATSWAMLALQETLTQELIADASLRDDLRDRVKHAASFLFDKSNRDSATMLWSLYPGWRGTPKPSLGTSGLVVFALHRYMDDLRAVERSSREQDMIDTDRAYLKALPENVPALDAVEGYNLKLPYIPVPVHRTSTGAIATKPGDRDAPGTRRETRVDSVLSLSLPWTLVGVRSSYRNGSYLERVKALKFVDRAITSIDQQLDGTLNANYWMAPEVLLTLRYLHEPNYLRH